MMATTHALAGMALAGVTALVAPEYTPIAVSAAGAGGVFPDLDLYGEHRQTLHYPVYYSVGAVAALAVALLAPAVGTVALAAFLGSAALHSVMDAFGGGLELKPWLATSERAVYDHYRERWIRPRRWIRYDGAPEDAALAGALALPTLALSTGRLQTAVYVLLAVSVVYTLVRKPMVHVTERLVDTLPPTVIDRLPARFTEDFTG
ncbi:metal-dependent hydrolase (plasmid) [Haloarcula salina]|uniref:metal-dependent hydrolase n=1 Tax=Haloarcula salina TaxID=1429914 RepID=UPI003C705A2B